MQDNNNEIVIDKGIKLARLSKKYNDILANFDCLDENEVFNGFRSKHIRKFKTYSSNINSFLQEESLSEQNQGLNTTFLLFFEDTLAGFMSLCTDCIRLDLSEKQVDNVPYTNIPSLKIARLAIDKRFQHKGLGKILIAYAIAIAVHTRNYMGIKFITVDCYKHRVSYYEKFGFVENISVNADREGDNPKSFRLNIDNYLESINEDMNNMLVD